MIGNPTVWDLLQMEGPCDLSYLDSLGPDALEASLLDAADKSELFNLVLLRAAAQIFADSPDTMSALGWLAKEVADREHRARGAA